MLETLVREVVVHDPYVREDEDVNLTQNLEKAVKGRDGIALVTRHREYSNIDLNWLRDAMRTPIIVDGRNVFKHEEARKAGFTFRGLGIGSPD